jgi:hypothetical protein
MNFHARMHACIYVSAEAVTDLHMTDPHVFVCLVACAGFEAEFTVADPRDMFLE